MEHVGDTLRQGARRLVQQNHCRVCRAPGVDMREPVRVNGRVREHREEDIFRPRFSGESVVTETRGFCLLPLPQCPGQTRRAQKKGCESGSVLFHEGLGNTAIRGSGHGGQWVAGGVSRAPTLPAWVR